MYDHMFFESRDELLQWLNDNHIPPESIISILPMPSTGNGYHREYELLFHATQTKNDRPKGKSRRLSENAMNYLHSVREREELLAPTDVISFQHDFDEGLAFGQEMKKLVPDLWDLLHVAEIDALISLVCDKTCECLRKQGYLSEESRTQLGR